MCCVSGVESFSARPTAAERFRRLLCSSQYRPLPSWLCLVSASGISAMEWYWSSERSSSPGRYFFCGWQQQPTLASCQDGHVPAQVEKCGCKYVRSTWNQDTRTMSITELTSFMQQHIPYETVRKQCHRMLILPQNTKPSPCTATPPQIARTNSAHARC